MEMCRLCAASLTRSSGFIDATMVPRSVTATTIASQQRLSGNCQQPLLNPQQQHRGINQQRLKQPTRHLSHQIQLQSQQQKQQHPGRPKSFKELIEMQKRERESESRQLTPEPFLGDGSQQERLNDSVDNFVEGSAGAPSSDSKRSPFVKPILSYWLRIRRSVAKMIRSSNKLDAKVEATLQKELPAYRHKLLRNYAKQNKLLQEYDLIMHATTRQMFFHGHPFRGAIMITATSPLLFMEELNQISSTLTTATILSYGFVFWYFYLAKLTQCVWFDAEKDMYYILMPYYQSAPITFKAGHVTEINDLFANLNIRGIKAYCPKELFYDANEYLRMFRSEKGLRR